MVDATGMFVQFPQPGGEHTSPGEDMPWNVADHRRKFLITPGDYLDGDGLVRGVGLTFWGEWEPPSRIERRWPAEVGCRGCCTAPTGYNRKAAASDRTPTPRCSATG